MRKAVEERISRRTFTGEAFTPEEIAHIEDLVKKLNEDSGLEAEFVEDARVAFSDVKFTYGFFKNVRSVIVLKGQTESENFREKVGYYGERIMLDLVDMGFGTCWVGGTFDRSVFTLPEGVSIPDVIVVGKVEKLGIKEKLMKIGFHDKKKSVKDRITTTVELPDWIKNGMEAVRMAPSAKNTQKPHFYFENGKVRAEVKDEYIQDMVDLGIAKFHFEVGAENGGNFEFGNGGEYILK